MNITLSISEFELEQLITWHREQQYEAANKELYENANWHKRRQKELIEIKRTTVGKSE